MYAPSSRFDEDAILARARSADGLEDFGDEEFREPLRVLLRAYADAPIHDLGAKILEGSVVRSLANRLRANHWFASYPEIAEEVLEAPLVVVGMMRSGTTLIQRLLASDPRHYCTMGWESLEPAPRLGVKPTDVDPRIADADSREQMTREFAAEYFSIHPSYARQAEEEIMFLADAFLSHVPEASCDVPEYRAYIDAQDFAPEGIVSTGSRCMWITCASGNVAISVSRYPRWAGVFNTHRPRCSPRLFFSHWRSCSMRRKYRYAGAKSCASM